MNAPSDRRIITILGYREMAEVLSVYPTTVMRWRAANRIPDRYRLQVWAMIKAERLQIDKTAFVIGEG